VAKLIQKSGTWLGIVRLFPPTLNFVNIHLSPEMSREEKGPSLGKGLRISVSAHGFYNLITIVVI
jgi:hypothetical protein